MEDLSVNWCATVEVTLTSDDATMKKMRNKNRNNRYNAKIYK